MKKQLILISMVLISCNLMAQENDRLQEILEEEIQLPQNYRGLEVGFNITTVLSKFVGNGPEIDAQDFPFILRLHRDRFAFRVGLGANFKSDTFFDATTQTNRDTEEKVGVLRIGMERKIDLRKRLSFYYGFDVFGGLIQESVSTFSFGQQSVLQKDIIRFGGGPLFGISYSINERIRLHTETNILGYYQDSTTSENIADTPVFSASTESFRATIEAPISLYINLKF